MFTSWRTKVKKVERMVTSGQLVEASREALDLRLAETRPGKSVIRQLTDSLVGQAHRFTSMGDFAGAWENMSWASSVALPEHQDQISREKTKLVDLTVEHAGQLLVSGKPALAGRVVSLLSSRKIMDRRADAIRKDCRILRQAEQLMAEGELDQAAARLEEALKRRPELSFLQSRVDSLRNQNSELSNLQGELRRAITNSNWNNARKLSGQMLQISPNHQVAIDAMRRCRTVEEKKANEAVVTAVEVVNDKTDKQDVSVFSEIEFVSDVSAQTPEIVEITDTKSSEKGDTFVPDKTSPGIRFTQDDQPESDSDNSIQLSSLVEKKRLQQPFLLWVDGVGGFWVCLKDHVTIGQVSTETKIDIPIQGDFHKSRLRLVRASDAYILKAFGQIRLDGDKLNDQVLLKDRHQIQIAKAKINFRRPHPLSNTAILQFETRHRTMPWSDGILLMDSSIVLGPDRNSHIVCDDWKHQLVLFERDGGLYCTYNEPYEIDGSPCEGQAKLSLSSRIAGEDFSVSLETIEDLEG